MAKKPSTTPMECQPYHHGGYAQPMAPAPTERTKMPRSLASAADEGRAEMIRKRSLKKQRSQISKPR